MRPRGSYGPVAQALIDAARAAPGAVRELCERAQVGYSAGQYTASRLVDSGALVVLEPGRPAVLGAVTADEPEGPDEGALSLAAAMHRWPGLVVLHGAD